MSAAHAELDTAIERAVSSLDTAIIENRLHDDPIRLVLVGLIQTLRAQRQLHAAANADMARHLEQARVLSKKPASLFRIRIWNGL